MRAFWKWTPQPSPVCPEQKWWQDQREAENEKATKQSITQPAGVKGPSDTGVAKRGAKRGRGGPGQGRVAVAVTKAAAPAPPAPIRGGKAARPPAKTPAARWVTLAAWGKRLADLLCGCLWMFVGLYLFMDDFLWMLTFLSSILLHTHVKHKHNLLLFVNLGSFTGTSCQLVSL